VAHLKPALTRANLTLRHRALVHRILLNNQSANGISYHHQGEIKTAMAAREIIVSAGAIKSPQILQLSGIGDQKDLADHGITALHQLPGVGQNLQDHLSIDHQQSCTKAVTLAYLNNPLAQLAVGTKWLLNRSGAAASNVWEMGGLVFGNQEVKYPNLQYHFTPVAAEYVDGKIRLHQGWTVTLDQLRPGSKGEVKLHSANPEHSPAVYFNYLSDPKDLRELKEGFKCMKDICDQPAFDEFRGKRLDGMPDKPSDAEIEQWIRQSSGTDYHPCGTCRMGNDEKAVVDGEMRVHGIEKLRVVDASVMPDIVSGNLNAPTQMIACRAADFILGKSQLEPYRPAFHFEQ